jgi:hypothetical protein
MYFLQFKLLITDASIRCYITQTTVHRAEFSFKLSRTLLKIVVGHLMLKERRVVASIFGDKELLKFI